MSLSHAAASVRCITRDHEVFNERRVECTDGSRAVTGWNRVFKEWRTVIITPGAVRAVVPPTVEERRSR
jgi:hypothetical protein